MPLGNDALSRILEALYEAPMSSSRWEEFLKLTAEAMAGEAGALIFHDATNAQSLVARQWNLDPESTRRYEEHYGKIDIWRQRVTTANDWLGTSERFVPFHELEATEFYNDLLLPYGIPHGAFGMVERGPARVANISIYRGSHAGPFAESDLELIRFLRPHIKRAYRIHTDLGATRAERIGLHAVLDSLCHGVILLGVQGVVVTMNRAAEAILRTNGGLRVHGGKLCAASPSESDRLQKLIGEALRTADNSGQEAGGAISISRYDLLALQVMVSPIRGMNLEELAPVKVVVFVHDPAQRIRPANQTLRALFGLTPAESRLALLLADGRALAEAAEIVGVSRSTVKSQLASIYSKTGTRRQVQLVRLLLQLRGI